MAVKLQPPSGTELPAFNPILPPAAVTQILLLANPNRVSRQLYRSTHCSLVAAFKARHQFVFKHASTDAVNTEL